MLPQSTKGKGKAVGLPVNVQAIVVTSSELQKQLSGGINPDGSLRPEAIRGLLKLKGIAITELADQAGYHNTYLHQVIDRKRRDRLVEDVIAKALGIAPEVVWARLAS